MRKNNYSRKITGAELLVLLQDGQRTTISIKELSDILTSKYESEGQLCSIKRDLENLNAKIKEINCNSNYAVQASEKALNTVKTQDDLLKEALRSAKQAEYDILKLEGAVERYNRKLNDLVVTIETDTTSNPDYIVYSFYQGETLITTMLMPKKLKYIGSKYIEIGPDNSIIFKAEEFSRDYIVPSGAGSYRAGNLINIDDNVINVDLDQFYDI